MKEVNFEDVDILLEWDERLDVGDHAWDDQAIEVLKRYNADSSENILFYAPRTEAAINIAIKHGIKFTQQGPDGNTVLFQDDLYDVGAYKILASLFAVEQKIDTPNLDGLTALSVQVKVGNLDNARVLLEHGASANASANIERYGGQKLTIPQQAINVLGANEDEDTEEISIQLFGLLKEFDLEISSAEKSNLLSRSERKQKLSAWIEENF